MKLTAASIRNITLPADKDDVIHFDSDLAGFGLRLRRSGGQSWVVQYAINGRTRRMALGSVAMLDAGKARATAKTILAAVRLGRDPVQEKIESQERSGDTFERCMKLYLERRRHDGKLRASSYGEIERHLVRNLKPLHSLPINTEPRAMRRAIALEHARITTACGMIQANRTCNSLSTFFNWCIGEGLVDSNPATHINLNSERARDRVLSDAELGKIWHALPERDYGDIVRLLMLSGQRLSEVGDLRWDEIDLDRSVIVLPPQRTKNGRQHVIPLSAPAAAILKARPPNGRALVFGSGQGGFSGWGASKARLDAAVQITPPWVIHDLRRTCATRMADLGVQPHIVEQILNHVSGFRAGVAGVYNKSVYQREVVTALERWAEHLMSIIEGRSSNVVAMPRPA
jgi:integrase